MLKVYIAGKVTGLSQKECYFNFMQAKWWVINHKGAVAVVPIELVEYDMPWLPAMVKLIPILLECDAIYVMSNWRTSRGTKLEMINAFAAGKEFIFQNEEDATEALQMMMVVNNIK